MILGLGDISGPPGGGSLWSARPRSGPVAVVVIIALTGVLGWFGALAKTRTVPPSSIADSTADWLVVSALADGIDPHTNLRELADHYDVGFWVSVGPDERILKHPRTPGALVLLYPLSWVEADQAYTVMLIVAMVSIALAMIVLSRSFSLPWIAICLGIAYATASGPARWSHLFGTQEPVLLLCVAMFLVLITRGDDMWAGVWLGVAGTMKVFPLVLLAILIARRQWKGLVGVVATMGVLDLTPLLLPHVSLTSTLDAMTSTASNWFDLVANVGAAAALARVLPVGPSVALWIGMGMVAAAWLLVMRRPGPLGVSSAFLICVGILALPFAWPHYLLAAVPAVLLAIYERVLTRWQFIGTLLAVLITIPLSPVVLHTSGLGLIAAVMGYVIWSRQAVGANPSVATPGVKWASRNSQGLTGTSPTIEGSGH